MNMRVLLLLGCLLAVSGQAQETKRELWTWTDANGVTHFSDRPVSGARRVEIATFTPAQAAAPAAPSVPSAPAEPAAPAAYRLLEVWQPSEGESFFGADAEVVVRVRSEPELATGHTLRLYLDGRAIEEATNAETHTLRNLERGAHSLTAVIADESGDVQMRSDPRVFHVRQPSVNEARAVGPNLRPPPPPPPKPSPGAPRS
jgi:Domain of unknown function (DUF4124)